MELRGTLLNIEVNERVAKYLYKKAYTTLTALEKKNCDTNLIKRVSALILLGNTDKERFAKLQSKVHNDHRT